jgi:hypothetical protein
VSEIPRVPDGTPAESGSAEGEPRQSEATAPLPLDAGSHPESPETEAAVATTAPVATPTTEADPTAWTLFDPAPETEAIAPTVEPPYQVSERYVVDADGELLEVAREGPLSRWWNSLSRNDRRFYFGSFLVFVVSTFFYCLGITAVALTPALQPPALAVAPTTTPTATATPFIVGLTPGPAEPIGPTPTFGLPVFVLPTATPRLVVDDPDPTATPTLPTPTITAPTPTPAGPALATAIPTLPTPTPALATPTMVINPATSPTVRPANATFTPTPAGTRPPAPPANGGAIPTSTPLPPTATTVAGPIATVTPLIPILPPPASPTPRP